MLRRAVPRVRLRHQATERATLAGLTVVIGQRWAEVMTMARRADARGRRRRCGRRWSTRCHVRDVFELACVRVGLMLDEDGPRFANWDQDATAIEDDYASQDPQAVADELVEPAHSLRRGGGGRAGRRVGAHRACAATAPPSRSSRSSGTCSTIPSTT